MPQKLILLPLLAQVLLTAIVFFRMYFARVAEMKSKRIHPQKIATTTSASQHLVDSCNVADNFSNQFELPVLLYVLTILLYTLHMADIIFIVLAWLFVTLRYLHSFIHCGYNKVLHRFYAYAAGSMLLWVMWVLFAVRLMMNL